MDTPKPHVVCCDTCKQVHRFATPGKRSLWATDHYKKTRHRPRAYDEFNGGMLTVVPAGE